MVVIGMAAAMVDRPSYTVRLGLVAGTALAYRHTGTGSRQAQGDHRHSDGIAGWADRRGCLTDVLAQQPGVPDHRSHLEVAEQGHITERYTKAIEQLGSDKLDVRLGGIYALEQIAVDSRRDHPTVVEVLSAFV
jgi:hypothetical protein